MVNNIFNAEIARENARMAGIDLGDMTDEDLVEAHEVARDEANEAYETPEVDPEGETWGWEHTSEDEEPPF